MPVGAWRSVGSSQNAFFIETTLDELAAKVGLDPVEMRVQMMSHAPSRKVVEAVAEMSNWGEKLPAGHGRSIAFSLSFGVPAAGVVEVAATDNGIHILKVWAAADVGVALDPGILEAQMISGANFGLSAAMMSEVTLDEGEVEQTNFHDYDALRINQVPAIKVRILQNAERIRGIGEPGTPPAAPARGNAIFAATGTRLREMPFGKFVEFVRCRLVHFMPPTVTGILGT